ncbi:hypothetical protein [Tritonibacter sp. SIMBA_163]|uniref:hypothetical protein n=1 Tax=Tritonibacter sp. SIMBA_163 TaxID=3080868 RepID=UPI0039810B16
MSENRLSRLSWWLHLLATLFVIGIVTSVVVVGFLFATDPNAVELTDFQVPAENIVVGPMFWLGFAISLIPTGFAIWAILLLRRLFRCYMAREVLTAHCATLIKKSGLALLIMAILRIVLQPVVTALMSWSAPPGERMLSLGFGTQDINFFFVAGLLVVIGWAMNEAAGAATENKAFV